MDQVEEVVAGYCKRLGAKPPAPRDDGAYVLRFENKYEVEVRPEGRDRLLLRAVLPRLKRDRDRQETLHRRMRINLLLGHRKRATLTLDREADTPFLYDLLDVSSADIASNFGAITGFVNEVAAF